MELVLVVLTPPAPAGETGISSQILVDILWANADPVDGLEHINVQAGPEPRSRIVGLYLLPGESTSTSRDAASRALRLCRSAIQSAPALSGWTFARMAGSTRKPFPTAP